MSTFLVYIKYVKTHGMEAWGWRNRSNGNKCEKIGRFMQWKNYWHILDLPFIENDDVDEKLPDIIDKKGILENCSEEDRKTALKK